MVEIKENLEKAIDRDKIHSMLETLSNITCLITDKVGYCDSLSGSESNLFFQILDRRYDKCKCSTIFTSNMKLSEWRNF